MSDRYYVVMQLLDFEDMQFETNLPFPVMSMGKVGEGQPRWYLPVFGTREEAEAWSEGRYRVMEIERSPVHGSK